jgi:hypothetical protein
VDDVDDEQKFVFEHIVVFVAVAVVVVVVVVVLTIHPVKGHLCTGFYYYCRTTLSGSHYKCWTSISAIHYK